RRRLVRARDMEIHMRRLLLTTVAVMMLTAGQGFAADLPRAVMKAPPAAPVTNWSGCYVAGGGGYGFWNQKTSFSNPTVRGADVTTGGRGWFGTVGGGCDLQIGGNWVIGAFGDYDFGDIEGDVALAFIGLWGHQKLTSAWAVGGRIGYLITPSILTYVSG